jgi:hypothetical protein
VPTATVVLRAGANNLTGTPIATVQTTANGTYTFTAQPTGTYTVAASKTGFTPGSDTVTVLNVDVQAPFTFLSPAGSTIAWRFVLSWGSAPSDLDAHLTGPFPASAARFHVYWDSPGSATQSPFAELDVDARFGFGPETITLTQQIPGVYRFFVDNFSGESPLSASAARVDVYQGNTLVQQFFPPQQSGNFWTVFEINGSVLTPINVINSVLPQLRAPAEGLTRTNTKAAKALDELLSLAPWTWTKPTGPIRR